ncbi:MAG: hypothetical protein EZS28_021827 [Streblomastix strix]|uniref:Uncharacterized protein n=1 Tax=Streblomastix strix TaxID=222440 RepID=A0A5J4VJA0_9EUKA|nr:MAG: hypothetical protein EZS28_021827 [Streblomastix strix]
MKRADTPHPVRQKDQQIRKNIKFFLRSSEMISVIDIYFCIIETLYQFPGRIGHVLLLSESGEQEICVNIRKMMAINNAPGSDKIRVIIDEQGHIEQKMAIERAYAMGISDSGTQSNIQNYFKEIYTEDIAKIYRAIAIGNDEEVNLGFDIECLVCKEVRTKCAPATSKENAPGHISTVITIMADGPSPPPFFILGGILNVPKYLQVLIDQTEVGIIANGSGWMIKDNMRIFARFLRD